MELLIGNKEYKIDAVSFNKFHKRAGTIKATQIYGDTFTVIQNPGEPIQFLRTGAPGDWLIKHDNGDLEVLTTEEFQNKYTSEMTLDDVTFPKEIYNILMLISSIQNDIDNIKDLALSFASHRQGAIRAEAQNTNSKGDQNNG